jgi:hypothetical protein
MHLERGLWRVRSRSRLYPADFGTGVADYNAARRVAGEILAGKVKANRRDGETLEELAVAYLAMPKKCSRPVAVQNVGRLRAIVRTVYGKALDAVRLDDIGPKLWRDFMAHRQGGTLDLSTRRVENAAINSAVRMAASLFIPKLRAGYDELGITLPDMGLIDWLPESKRPPAAADDGGLIEWWQHESISCQASNPPKLPDPLWLAVGLARFAGLRRNEIEAATPEWIVSRNGSDCIALHDRDEHSTKTGAIYYAPILRPELAAAIRQLPAGQHVVQIVGQDRHRWFTHKLPAMVRPWVGTATKPLHRLRGLYADDVARITADAVAARLAGIQAAASALGHTSTTTTINHYLSHDQG